MKAVSIAIVGATGLVGTTTLSLLEERKFPIKNLFLLASKRSQGEMRNFRGRSYPVQVIDDFDFSQADISFFCVGNDLSAVFAPKAAASGCIVIDKSSYFRYDPDVPLIVPEVNLVDLPGYKKKNIIANANCSTIPIAVAIKPLYDAVGIARLNIATYQSVSGTGKEAVAELQEQTQQSLVGEKIQPKVYPQQIAFNVIPHCDDFQENNYTREEMKMVWELQKIFNDKMLAINPTAVRVPVYYGHSAAVHIETKKKITAQQAMELLAKAPGVKLITGTYPYPTPVKEAAGTDDVFVGRVREDISHERGLNLWVVADNLRKGAALNAIQVAEALLAAPL